MPEPTPEHLILLQGILTTGQQQSKATLDLVEVFRYHAAESARRDTEHEAAAQRRHEELRPMMEAYRVEIEARASAVARAQAEVLAEHETEAGRLKKDRDLADKRAAASRARLRALGLDAVKILVPAALTWLAATYGGAPVAGGPSPADASPTAQEAP